VSEENKQVVLAFIDAMGKGDAESAARCITEDAYTLARGFGSFAGVREHDTILATIGAFRELMPEGMQPKIVSVIADGDRVVVEFEGNGVLFNGEPYGNEYCMVFRLRDGRICQVNEYFCTLLAEQRLWPVIKDMSL
jgi:ketosteroid isomerase-like protein